MWVWKWDLNLSLLGSSGSAHEKITISISCMTHFKRILKILWGLFNSVLSYELICDESTKIRVFVVVFWQFRWLISINSKFQCEHNFNQLLRSIPYFWLKITWSSCVEVSQNQALLSYGKTKKICTDSAQTKFSNASLSKSYSSDFSCKRNI